MGRSLGAGWARVTSVDTGRQNGLLAAALMALLGVSATGACQTWAVQDDNLPDAPSVASSVQVQDAASGDADAQKSGGSRTPAMRPCKDVDQPGAKAKETRLQGPPPCMPENPISPIVTSVNVQPLNSREKGVLAIRDFLDPFNIVTLAAYSGFAVAKNSHSPYGPGLKGWGRLTGYGLVEGAQGEFLATYAIPSLVREDPRYHRLPQASMKRRIWHAVEHTYVSQHDDGRPMPNYATLLTYPISAELSNLYVPGIQTDGRSTGEAGGDWDCGGPGGDDCRGVSAGRGEAYSYPRAVCAGGGGAGDDGGADDDDAVRSGE